MKRKHSISLLIAALSLVVLAQQPYTGDREYVVRYTYDDSGNVATRRATLEVLHDELDALADPGLDTTIVNGYEPMRAEPGNLAKLIN